MKQEKRIADAVYAAYKETGDIAAVLRELEQSLRKANLTALRLPVLRAVERMIERERHSNTVTVYLPSVRSDADNDAQRIADAKVIAGKHAAADERIEVKEKDIIGGYITEHNGIRRDRSHRAALLRFYEESTA